MEKNILERILDRHQEYEFLKASGLDGAVIGIEPNSMRLVYSVTKVMEILEQQMTPFDAAEHFEFNIVGAFVGDQTPIFVDDNY